MKRKNDDGNILDRAIGAYSDHRERQRRIGCTIGLIAVGVFLVLGVIVAIISFIFVRVEEANTAQTYGDQIASLCTSNTIGSETIDNMPEGESPFKMLILETGTKLRHEWHDQLPLIWRADTGDDVQLVACVSEETVTLEECRYPRASADGGSYTISIEREQILTTVTILNPQTGLRIASNELAGAEPEDCPVDDGSFSTSDTIRGGSTSADEFATWIQGFIEQGSAGDSK